MSLVSKIAVLVFATILVSGAAVAAPAADKATAEVDKAAMKGKDATHEVTATLVSMDAKAHTVTLKGEDGKEVTATCMGNAIKEMANFKPGDKVTCTCKDNAKGEHLGVSAIKAAK